MRFTLTSFCRPAAMALLAVAFSVNAMAEPTWVDRLAPGGVQKPAWAERLEARLALLEAGFNGEIGLHVRELGEGGARYGWRDGESWYLASLIKVPVAIELMARVEAGEASLDDRLVLLESDYVDGAGPTNWAPPGSEPRLRQLLEPMLIVSDNTASDMLIRHVGLDAVNRRARSLVADSRGLGPITTLEDVRRHVYAGLHPDAFALTGRDFIELRKHGNDAERLDWFIRRLGLAPEALRLPTLEAAFDAYYASDLNSGRLDSFGDLLAELGEGRALGAAASAELLSIMTRTTSGDRRLKSGFGSDVRFAHKTGTQHRRTCDAGIASHGQGDALRKVVVVACVRGESNVVRSESVMAGIGRAMREAGVFARH
ncbi:serine hydrolase [Billgrantia endophytica]|uniref:Serine hydrolase n=1 Tax=Billgrantia endophytica TaxID=2033802 RepID=A0A2N7U421_9GAMM|nr:serine hydrolase [Halomonas endophytica]PMR75173.1 serine hydrolase [Halomonas endophytica]